MDNLMGSRAFVITNLSTLFTFIIPQEFPCTFDSITKTFLMRLRFSLLAASPPVEWKPSEVIPVRGNPRAVIGSMNDMISMVTFRREANNFDGTEAEDFLNRTPFSMIGMKRPKDRFMDQLQALSGHINR